ncbi:MAG: hypothetical protein KAS07_00095 [Candidatus Pacebacteria bacterium]|nr:hypothetical protein [Candidatus Paceibacterota bacterium]
MKQIIKRDEVESLINKLFSRKIANELELIPNKELLAEITINSLYGLHDNKQLENCLKKSTSFGSPAIYSISLLKRVATPAFAPRIGAILEWDEWYSEKDRSNRNLLVEIIGKIGRKKDIKYLHTFVKKVEERVSYKPIKETPEELRRKTKFLETEIRKVKINDPQIMSLDQLHALQESILSPEKLKKRDEEIVEKAINAIKERDK